VTVKTTTQPNPADDVDATIADEQLATDLAKLAETKTAIEEEIATRKAEWLRRHPDTGTRTAGPFKVIVTAPERLDTKALEDAFPIAHHPELYVAKIDATAVKEHLSPAQLRVFKTTGAKSVTVR
jgi:hypothetical protein